MAYIEGFASLIWLNLLALMNIVVLCQANIVYNSYSFSSFWCFPLSIYVWLLVIKLTKPVLSTFHYKAFPWFPLSISSLALSGGF
jgi:hypothetical protein